MTPEQFLAIVTPLWAKYGDDIIDAAKDIFASGGDAFVVPRPRPFDPEGTMEALDREAAREGRTAAEIDVLNDLDDQAEEDA
ncbi:MAG: hypothetical protein EOO74_03920 [Myxococcales bacterium]|nr:MAG: hypothetical protein EOO74_03920 [Myxococcales bacterium]